MNKKIKRKIFILSSLFLVLIFVLLYIFYLKNRDINKYKSNFITTYNEDDILDKNKIFNAYAAVNLIPLNKDFSKYEDYIWKENCFNSYNKSVEDTIKNLEMFYGAKNDLLNNLKKNDYISFSYFTKISTFPSQFEILDDSFGIIVNSDAANSSVVSVNYYNDFNNYSLSLFDNEGDELIYMKSDKLNSISYKDSFNLYLDLFKENNNYMYFGEDSSDSALFPSINIILDSKMNNVLFSDYIIGGRINISGLGEFTGNSNFLDKKNIKYNFSQNSILFIRKKGCEYPYLIIPFI